MKFHFLYIITLLISFSSKAQNFSIKGQVKDDQQDLLIGATVTLQPIMDSTNKQGTTTDASGKFEFIGIPKGKYLIKSSYVGFKNYTKFIKLDSNINNFTIQLVAEGKMLDNVTLKGKQVGMMQSGDTTNLNANAYKTNPDATTEDLVNKMPGITTEGGTLKSNGEQIKKVLVDGKPFFGDDPNAAIKNLPAEVVDRIQIFDKLSDQAQLTGFNDGQEVRTMNIITRPGRNNGVFGKVYGGAGTQEKNTATTIYNVGGSINFFKGSRRISILGMSNNINQQNFTTEDLTGVMSQSSGQGFGGGRGGDFGGGRGGDMGGGGSGNFMVGQQQGITQTHSFGINYSDQWTPKIQVSGSYFFNATENNTDNILNRNYFSAKDKNIQYQENSVTTTNNINHRAQLRMEYTIDSFNSLIFAPRISVQDNRYEKNLLGSTLLPDGSPLNSSLNNNQSHNVGYNLNGNLTYNHKFNALGRSYSINISTSDNNKDIDGGIHAMSQYKLGDTTNLDTTITLDQQYNTKNSTRNYSTNVTYTEPLNKKTQLQISYNPSVQISTANKETYLLDSAQQYTKLDTSISNKYDNTYSIQKGGVSIRFNDEKWMMIASINAQQAQLNGSQQFPFAFDVAKSFNNILPSLMVNYKFSRTKNLRFNYRTNTNAPSINQLQQVFDVSNPLLIKTGNPLLTQDFQHNINMRFGNTNSTNATNFFVMAFLNVTQNYIGNASYILNKDSVVVESILLNRGAQLTRPVNLDGYWNSRIFATYGFPVKKIKSNINLNSGLSYSSTPAIINNLTNKAENYALNSGVVISSNVSEALDFTLSYSGYYNIVKNTVQTQSNSNYYNHNASFKINYLFQKRWVFNSSINNTTYAGLADGFNQNFWLWNMAFGYKLLKDKSLDIRVTAYDLLNQNKAISRNVTETYIEDNYTNVLQRYFMLNITYTIRKFNAPENKPDPMFPRDEMMPYPQRRWNREQN